MKFCMANNSVSKVIGKQGNIFPHILKLAKWLRRKLNRIQNKLAADFCWSQNAAMAFGTLFIFIHCQVWQFWFLNKIKIRILEMSWDRQFFIFFWAWLQADFMGISWLRSFLGDLLYHSEDLWYFANPSSQYAGFGR